MVVESAGQWRLIWRRFRRHKLGMVGGMVALLFYLVAAFPEFLAPHDAESYSARHPYAPPQAVRLFQDMPDGSRALRPHVVGTTSTIDYESGRREFTENPEDLIYLGLFVKGYQYRLLGLVPASVHLLGPVDPATGSVVARDNFHAQLTQTYDNLRQVLSAAGASPADVVRSLEFVNPQNAHRYDTLDEARRNFYSDNLPAVTTVTANQILPSGANFGLEAWAVLE